jgi:integrase
MRAKITKRTVDRLKPGDFLADLEIKGFVVRRLPSGKLTYGFRYRVNGKPRWLALGLHGSITPDEARELAKKRAGEVADHRDPRAEQEAARVQAQASSVASMNAVLDNFVARHVRKNLRSAHEVERVFNVYVRPRLGTRTIYELRRSDIVKMLDEIEDANGPVMADRVLAHTRKAFTWQAARDDAFNPPIVRGMARTKPKERARDRTLTDEELRDLWLALDKTSTPYPQLMRTLLLTAQRRDEVARMRWEELSEEIWSIPGDRDKTKTTKDVPLISDVHELLGDFKKKGFVFSTTGGKKPFSGFSKAKAALDKAIQEIRQKDRRGPMPSWRLHDLRRTARSLMSRAGVPTDIAERVLGHVIPGVRGVYDRHSYFAEKRDALGRLASLMNQILNPSPNVVSFPATA